MSKYSELSDFEINKRVAIACGYSVDEVDLACRGKSGVGVKWDEVRGTAIVTRDYCNNASHAWPIITGCRIALYPPFDRECTTWEAHTVAMDGTSNGDSAFSKNPVRAAMIVYLMMQEHV